MTELRNKDLDLECFRVINMLYYMERHPEILLDVQLVRSAMEHLEVCQGEHLPRWHRQPVHLVVLEVGEVEEEIRHLELELEARRRGGRD